MIKSRKHKLLIALIFVCTCCLAISAESNEAKTELKFEIRSDRPPQFQRNRLKPPPYEATHFAVVFVKGGLSYLGNDLPFKSILETSAGRAMSQKNRDFISEQLIQIIDYGMTFPNYTYFRLYSMDEEDTKKMVEALIETLANKANEKMLSLLSEQDEHEAKITGAEKEIIEKETELKNAINRFKEVKKNVHYLSTDEAKQAILELNTILNNLEIELAGMTAKRTVIQEHKERQEAMKNQIGINREGILLKLENMWIDLLIELKVAEAKKSTAVKIRNAAEEFYNRDKQKKALPIVIERLKKNMAGYQKSLHYVEEHISELDSDMLPPQVYQNKVTIYPVK